MAHNGKWQQRVRSSSVQVMVCCFVSCQAIPWNNADLLSIAPLTKFNESRIQIQHLSFYKMHLEMQLNVNWHKYCSGFFIAILKSYMCALYAVWPRMAIITQWLIDKWKLWGLWWKWFCDRQHLVYIHIENGTTKCVNILSQEWIIFMTYENINYFCQCKPQ